jgi:methionine biosynthesis protein MetW
MKPNEEISIDHRMILSFIPQSAHVLDLGCGDCTLLKLLKDQKKIRGQGIDIDEDAVYQCVEKGLSVFYGDLDSGLADYSDKSFDIVIMNQSLEQVKKLREVLMETLRVGKKVIIGFPNFGYFRNRLQLFFNGKTPVTPSLPYPWYESPNLHFFTIQDFMDFCHDSGIKIEKSCYVQKKKRIHFFPNWRANLGIFLLSQGEP